MRVINERLIITREGIKSSSGKTKIIIAGNIIEVYTYERLNTSGGGNLEGNGEFTEQNYKQTQRRRRNSIRHLITSNFDKTSKFVTLTFRDTKDFDITDVKECNERFKLFIKRLKYRYQNFIYLAVIEFQDKTGRGAVHYHMVCNLPYIKKQELSDIWDYGFIKINAIDKVDNIGAYVIKYMVTDIDDKRLQGLKAYNCSKGLQKPFEFKSWERADKEIIREILDRTKERSPSYCSEYESDGAGKIVYSQYNLLREEL